MQKHSLQVKPRDLQVKNSSYRHDGFVLANLYGEGASRALIVEEKLVTRLLPKVSESTVIYLSGEGESETPAMISEVQKDVITGRILHLALRHVNLKNKVVAPVDIEVIGVFGVPEAVYLLVKDEVEAEALPTDLPEKLVVDVSKFTAVGQQVTYADLDYDRSKVKLMVENEDEPVVVVNVVKEEVEEVPAVVEAAVATEGAAPAEAGATPSPAPAASGDAK